MPVPPELAAIQTEQQARELAARDPVKAQQLANYIVQRANTAQALQQELATVRAQQQQIQAQHFQTWADAQDTEFEKHCGAVDRALQQEALVTLREAGVSDELAAQAWNGAPVSLRSSAAQRLVLDATRWRLAQEKARTAITKPVPMVQRPGVRMPDRTGAQVEADRLSKALDSNRGEGLIGLRTAAQLVAQRRLARA
jgi:hypothetical protein